MKWISAEERLPPEQRDNIFIANIYSHDKHRSFVLPLYFILGQWYDMVYGEGPLDGEYDVTHWMFLPEPPK